MESPLRSRPNSSTTPTIPITMPTARMPEERSSLSRNGARIAVEIGEAATRMLASEEEMCFSPSPISVSGTPMWIAPRRATSGARRPSPFNAPRRRASGNSTSAASPQRIEVISAAENERRPILMKR